MDSPPHHVISMGTTIIRVKRNNGFSVAKLHASTKDINLANNMRRNLDNMMKSLPSYMVANKQNASIYDTQKLLANFQNSSPKVIASVMNTIKKLNQLKERNWSTRDLNVNTYKPMLRVNYQNRVGTTTAYRVDYKNLQSPNALEANQIPNRKLHTSAGKFQELPAQVKPYGVSNETFAVSWVDRGAVQLTSNHESTNYNLISHSSNKSLNIKEKLSVNPYICRKSKGIAEYQDLTRVTSSKLNECYQNVISTAPLAFGRSSGSCAKECDNGRTFGPLYNFQKK